MSLASAEVRELRGQIREWRRGRADTRLVDALGDAYIAVFATVMLTSMAISVIVNLRVEAGQACTGSACVDARATLPWVFALAVVTVCLGLARLFGPMLVSPAVGSWLLTAPVDRGALLRPQLFGAGLAGLVIGGALTAAGSGLAGFGADAVAAFAVTVGALCLGAVGVACLAQARDSRAAWVADWALAAVAWLGLLLLAVGASPFPAAPPRQGAGWLLAATAACAAAAPVTVGAAGSLRRLRRDQLTPGGTLVPGLSGALAGLDLALVYDILLERHWRARTVHPVRGRGSGVTALVWRDVVRLRRSPRALVVLFACLVLPYLAGTLGLGRAVVLVATVAGFFGGLGFFTALRVLSRTPGLLRFLPFEPWVVKGACAAVPAVTLLVWGLCTAPVLHTTIGLAWPAAAWAALAVGAVVVAALVRWLTGRPPDYRLPLVTSPMGAVPTSLYGSVARGFDVLLLGTVPLLFSPTPQGATISLAIAAGVVAVLLVRR